MRSIVPFLVLLLASCGDGKSDAARALAERDSSRVAAALVDLSAYDMPLLVTLPDGPVPEWDSLYGKPQWVEEFGHMRISAGERFGITITEDRGDVPRLKADLERDMLRTNTILEEAPTVIVYRQEFPDQELVFFHFYQVLEVGDRSFILESSADGRFNEEDIAFMRSAVQPALTL